MLSPKNFTLEHPHPSKECKPCTIGRPIVYAFALLVTPPILFYYVWKIFPFAAMQDLFDETMFDMFVNYARLLHGSFINLRPELNLVSILLCTHCFLMAAIRLMRIRVTIFGMRNWLIWLAQVFISGDAFACALLSDQNGFRYFTAAAATFMVVYLEFYRLRASRQLWNTVQFPDYR